MSLNMAISMVLVLLVIACLVIAILFPERF